MALICKVHGNDHCCFADSARVLVTHQRQYLLQCDLLLVLRGGRVHACGTPAQLAPLNLSELQITAGVTHVLCLRLLVCDSGAVTRCMRKAPTAVGMVVPAEAELDDAAYDANMRRAASSRLPDVLNELESGGDSNSLGESGTEGNDGSFKVAASEQQPAKAANEALQSWDDAVEEGYGRGVEEGGQPLESIS